MERGIFGVCGPWALRNYGGTARSIRERDTFRLWIHVWERSRRGRTGELALERSLHRSMRSGSRTDLRLCGDEVGRPVLGSPSSMVVVDLNERRRSRRPTFREWPMFLRGLDQARAASRAVAQCSPPRSQDTMDTLQTLAPPLSQLSMRDRSARACAGVRGKCRGTLRSLLKYRV